MQRIWDTSLIMGKLHNLGEGYEELINIPKSTVLELAHEVRNPLTLIKSTIEMVKRKNESLTPQQYIHILREVDRINRIMEKFVSLTDTPKIWEQINLSRLVSEVRELVEAECLLSNISFKLESVANDVFIHGDSDQIKQVLINIASNSIDAMSSAGGQLRFYLKEVPDNKVEILISDTGSGIGTEIMQHIFQPYFTTKSKGTGLGLAICKRIIEEHNGQIGVENNPELGCTFSIILPRVHTCTCTDKQLYHGM